ncbi:MAG: amino acid permease [Armatimonadota bacterium]
MEPDRPRDDSDEADLARLGYAQQLLRDMGGFSNFAISFSIISILTGAVLLYGYGLKFAGPIVNTVGWPIASLMTLAVAASMGELASAYPTAGGLYFWAFRLGGKGTAWATAWLNMIGQVTATAGINIAAATYLIGAVVRIFGIAPETTVPLLGATTDWNFQVAVMALIMVPQVLVNCFGIRPAARLNDISVWWHIGGVLAIVGCLAVLGKHHNPTGFLLQATTTTTPLDASSAEIAGRTVPALVFGDIKLPSPLFAIAPWLRDLYAAAPIPLVFVLALLQAQWTYTGYDASAHVAEETKMARKNAAWGIVLSVGVSAVAGYALLLALTWCIPNGDIAATASDTYPVLQILSGNLPKALADALSLVIGGAMWLCGSASISSMGRMWYAFARDDGMPGSRWLKQVHPRFRTPIPAIVATSVLTVATCVWAAAYPVVTSISTIALYLAYVIPIALNARNRRTGRGEHVSAANAAWNLGRHARWVNAVAIGWVAVLAVVFSLPPNELVLWTTLLLGAVLAAYWFGYARGRFAGPTPADEAVLRADLEAGG